MQTTPCGTTRFSRFLRNSFLRFVVAFAPAAGAAAASCAFSFAIFRLYPFGGRNTRRCKLLAGHHFLLRGHCALTRTLSRARIRMRTLTAHRKIAPMPQSPIRLNFDQAADIHLGLLAEIAFDPPLTFNRVPKMVDLFLSQLADFLRRVDVRLFRQIARALLPDTVNGGQPDPQPLVGRQVNTCDTCHSSSKPTGRIRPCKFIPGAGGASDSNRSRGPRRADERSCTSCKSF